MLARLVRPAVRRCCDAHRASYGTVSTGELEELLRDGGAVVIDVRGEGEIAATGPLSLDALNVPLADVLGGALRMDGAEFEAEYGAPRPAPGDKIVFSCAAGVRSAHAAGACEAAGFADVHNYLGGAFEWFATPRR